MTPLAAGFLLGIAGGAHCLGMCGPLALFGRASSSGPAFGAYHAARIGVYVAFGALAGWAGTAIAGAGWRNGLAMTAGVVLIAQAVGLVGWAIGPRSGRALRAIASGLAELSRRLPQQPISRSAVLGTLNGLLPCGLLYGALAAAAGLGRASDAIVFMTGFGLGALPAFAVLAGSTRVLIPRDSALLRYAAPAALVLVGGLLIARGLTGHAGHVHGGHDELSRALAAPR